MELNIVYFQPMKFSSARARSQELTSMVVLQLEQEQAKYLSQPILLSGAQLLFL